MRLFAFLLTITLLFTSCQEKEKEDDGIDPDAMVLIEEKEDELDFKDDRALIGESVPEPQEISNLNP